ncbi:DNA (cytosine-5-)-methyltransferase [Burkholderia territorii]|uniref:DNA (cytosine-5-)-methyltransferase n=1 Tax=Burkholderia territorii TaxID=1503055 RepID=UPI0007595D39|nr:DNA cytosine methyltransferase [Burkholderia territorii]KWO62584.1 DNA methyltransferase [Burkholderia territorii]
MIYGSVCSGIEAATVAWHPHGWRPAWFSEIEPFPCAVLAHHYPHVPNLGDMTRFKEWPDAAIDVLVGGTPCQSFSVAGLRKGLADPRGNLMLTYLAIAERFAPRWLVWENVPGVLSSNDGRDFGTFLGGLAELGYGFAYRVLDAQYFGVAQRRRRVFVVGHLGDWRRAAAVLFERESLLGHPAPSRKARQGIAPTLSARTKGGGGLGTDFECDGGLIPQAFGGNNTSGAIEVAAALNAKSTQRQDFETETLLVAHSLRGEGFDAGEDGTGRGTPLVPVPFDTTQITSPTNRSQPRAGDACHPLAASAHAPAIAFDCKASGQNGFGVGEIASTMRSMGHAGSHQNGGGHLAVAFQSSQSGVRLGEAHATLDSNNGSRRHNGVVSGSAVRRLTPRECERLQGFPDDYTLINVRSKRAADGPRYKALGNSMAVPVMRWIGARIQLVDDQSPLAIERSAGVSA